MTTPTTGGGSTDSTGTAVNTSPAAPPTALTSDAAPTTIGAVETDAVTAVQTALGTAHAAVWTYGIVLAYAITPGATTVDPTTAALVTSSRLANAQIRDSASDLLTSLGQQPARTEVAYRLPVAVVDLASAQQAAVAIEKDSTTAWRAVVGATDNYALRQFALTALSDAAVRLSTWRTLAGVVPATVPFPGAEA